MEGLRESLLDGLDQFIGGWPTAFFVLGKDQFTIEMNIQDALASAMK
ncbi:hypothetical protein L6R29_11115 [Myxococcota bacterium]|nr:hypothetical protein [Myxococcota bacterium]